MKASSVLFSVAMSEKFKGLMYSEKKVVAAVVPLGTASASWECPSFPDFPSFPSLLNLPLPFPFFPFFPFPFAAYDSSDSYQDQSSQY